MKSYIKIILSCLICMTAFGLQAQTLSQARIYINPGHGGWGSEDRPLATINYAALDTLGFFETNTDLWKAQALQEDLTKAGAGYIRMSRTKNGIAPSSQGSLNKYEVYEGSGQIVTLSAICQDVETNNMDYFISIHSNALTDGTSTNYPLLLYRGTDTAVGNGLVNAKKMGTAAWPFVFDNGVTYYSSFSSTNPNVRGDITFMGSSITTLGYTGYYGALRHGCDGYISEGCFHTYHPERHRLLNRDYCRQEGIRYARAIRSWFGDNSETKGCIMGTVKDATKALTHTWYQNAKSNDLYYPLNGATVILKSGGVEKARYTTDKEYNGIFVFTGLDAGTYQLEFRANGFEDGADNITVTANKTAFINKRLQPGISSSTEIPVKELWKYSLAAGFGTTLTDNSDFLTGIAVSVDGKKLYLGTRANNSNQVAVYDAAIGTRTGYLPALTDFQSTYGGDVAVDGNGAIYASNVTIENGGVLKVAKWTNDTATPVTFINTTIADGLKRTGYGMDVYVDEEGNGFLLMHSGGASPNNSTNLRYWEINNNAVLSQTPATIAITNSTAMGYARISIIDKKSFWIDGDLALPYYCEITRASDDYSNPTGVTGKAISNPSGITAPNPSVCGVDEFRLGGKRYLVYGYNQHATTPSPKNSVLLQEVSSSTTSAVSFTGSLFGPYPENGLGGLTNDLHAVKPVVHVRNDSAFVYIFAKSNGFAAQLVRAVRTPALTPAPGEYSVSDLEVEMASATAEAVIRYTTNGSTPTTSSTVYTGPITLQEGTTTIKMLATKDGLFSNLSEATYIVDNLTGLHEATVNYHIIRTPLGIEIALDRSTNIEIFSTSGQLIEKTTASGSYFRNLDNGVYIIRIDGKTVKFVK